MQKCQDFHCLPWYNWKIEGVTTKSFNSNNNKSVSINIVRKIKTVAFCNKWVWGTSVGYNVQICAEIIGFSLSVLVQLDK